MVTTLRTAPVADGTAPIGVNTPDVRFTEPMTVVVNVKIVVLITQNAPFKCSPEAARETVGYLVRGTRKIVWQGNDPGTGVPKMPKPINMPSDFTFVNRLQWGLASVLGGVGCELPFRTITEPWIRDEQWPLP